MAVPAVNRGLTGDRFCGPRATHWKNNGPILIQCYARGTGYAYRPATPLGVRRVPNGQEPFRPASVKAGEALAREEGARVMGHQRNSSKRGGLTASVAAVALVLTGVPTAGFALDAFDAQGLHLARGDFPFTPASVDPKL